MFNLDKFIADSVTFRPVSMFAADIEANKEVLTREIKGKKVCVIGGAGSIGSSFNMTRTCPLSYPNSNDKAQFAAFLDFVLEMRKDLCNNKQNSRNTIYC